MSRRRVTSTLPLWLGMSFGSALGACVFNVRPWVALIASGIGVVVSIVDELP